MLTTLVLAVLSQTQPEALDATSFRGKLMLLTDGQGHYIAVDPAAPYDETTFVGDGKQFTRVRIRGGGKNGAESWNAYPWDPRASASIDMAESGAKYSVSCGKKTTPLTAVAAEDAKKLLADAKFTGPSWTRLPEKLLRDDKGTYYFVDRFRAADNQDRRDFRVFSGRRGAMKQLPLKNIVDDSQGMVLATKTGNLRLVTGADGKFEGKWVQGKSATSLIEVPLDNSENARMVYMDLGPYSGQRLGSPCDDFM